MGRRSTDQMKDPVTGNLTDKVKNENADFPGEGLLNETYHVYGLDWTAGKFKWTIDEIEMWTLDYGKLMTDPNNVNVFDDGYFHIILDVAIGGRMFGIGYGNNKPSYEELCADGNSFTATQIDYVRVYQEIGKHNFRVSADSDVTVKGSAAGIAKEGANCPFDGCVGTTWNQRVDEISGVSGATTTAAAPAASTAAGAKPTGSAAAVATTTVKPSGASGQTISMVLASALMVIAGFFASL